MPKKQEAKGRCLKNLGRLHQTDHFNEPYEKPTLKRPKRKFCSLKKK